MRRRRLRNKNYPSQNLDSFLDILTNTVGVLMFIGLFVSLLAVEAGTIIRTPLVSKSNKIAHFFEIRNNQVFYLDYPKVDYKIDKLLKKLPKCYPPNIPESVNSYLYDYDFYLEKIQKYQTCWSKRHAQLRRFYVNTGYYVVSFIDGDSLKYEPISTATGDDKQELRANISRFNEILKQLDPSINYLAFIVRPDSFATFRVAREKAWQQGFDVGWEPFPQNSILVFGSGGRSIGVQ